MFSHTIQVWLVQNFKSGGKTANYNYTKTFYNVNILFILASAAHTLTITLEI